MHRIALYILSIVVTGTVILLLIIRNPFSTREKHDDVILSRYAEKETYGPLAINYPYDGTCFPSDIAPPVCVWRDETIEADAWYILFDFDDGGDRMYFRSDTSSWIPEADTWEAIKKRSREHHTTLRILGIRSAAPVRIVSKGEIKFYTSQDEVGAPIFYREVNLPFVDAVKDPSHIRWRFGAVSSTEQPPVILENLPVCGNCHSFSRDGSTLAMDVDYANSKGSYIITRINQQMVLATSDIITWNRFREEDGEQTFGLLSQISPDGRYVVSTVKDKSVFVPEPDLYFSQLFFPIKGILCIYDRQTDKFFALPGADDPQYVQSNPCWSPDGTTILFARSGSYDLQNTKGKGKVLLTREECREFTVGRKPFIFDLYRIPFNSGRGGKAEPVKGAAQNGMSNFFARYSPDGKWIVFCKAKSYMLLQPDSKLYIMPADGGEVRELICNTERMNSWHSWSPNSKWLVFSSKQNSPFTQLFLTHIDVEGRSTPPVLLSRFTSPDRAANIPEFVNTSADAIAHIKEGFLNDYSFVRAGNEFFRAGDADNAIIEYYKALELNPDNETAHLKLGFLLFNVKNRQEEGLVHLNTALRLNPHNGCAHYDFGMAMLFKKNFNAAVTHLARALTLLPQGLEPQYHLKEMHYYLGIAYYYTGAFKESSAHLYHALEHEPENSAIHYQLAISLAAQGDITKTIKHYKKAIYLNGSIDTSAPLHEMMSNNYVKRGQYRQAVASAQKALALAQAQGDEQHVTRLKEKIDNLHKNSH